MANPTIVSGGITCTFITLKGVVDPPGEVVETIKRPGVAGATFRTLASQGQEFELAGIADFTSEANAKAGVIAYKGLQGTLCTITDDHGQSWTSYMCLQVQSVSWKAGATARGGVSNGAYLVGSRWRFMAAGG